MKPLQMPLESRQRLLLGLTGAFLVLVLSARFVYLPLISWIGERRGVLENLRVKIADAHVLAEQLPGQEKALQLARERYGALVEGRIGKGQSVAHILEKLSQRANGHQLELVAVQPRTDQTEPHRVTLGPETRLRIVPLTLQLTGRYRQVGEFLEELVHAPMVTSVQSLKLTKPQADSAKLQADLVLAVYLAEEIVP